MPVPWLPEPPAGTQITLGFDGSETHDWTAIRARTRDGVAFTPRHGGDLELPTIWNPAEHAGGIPRVEVKAAIKRIFGHFRVRRFYYDPPLWETDGEEWERTYGDDVVYPWETYRTRQMHEGLRRYHTDLSNRVFTHDGCPLTEQAASNARKVPRGDRYILGKPSQHQKIDPLMADVLAHIAWVDALAEGWDQQDVAGVSHVMYGFN